MPSGISVITEPNNFPPLFKVIVLILAGGQVKSSNVMFGGTINNIFSMGQLNFSREENSVEDNPPIGIVLSARKNEIDVEYALGGITNKLFVSKYKLYLPDKQELEQQVQKVLKGGKE